jgi:pimeloyl-ACP methyl ester carboxylesterase
MMKTLNVNGHVMAYRDVGEGEIVVIVHGTPSSSEEFSVVMDRLKDKWRLICIDHLGFGESDKPAQADYSITGHRSRLLVALDQLGIKNFHLVVHDFGGAIGLPIAMDFPDRVKTISILNSWLWLLEETDKGLKRQKWLMRSAFIRWLYLHANLSARLLVKAAWGKHAPLTAAKHQSYISKFRAPSERHGTVAFLQAIFDTSEASWGLHQKMKSYARHPVQLIWGESDVISAATADRWKELIPSIHVTRLPKVRHFVADEAPELVAPILRDFWSQSSSSLT